MKGVKKDSVAVKGQAKAKAVAAGKAVAKKNMSPKAKAKAKAKGKAKSGLTQEQVSGLDGDSSSTLKFKLSKLFEGDADRTESKVQNVLSTLSPAESQTLWKEFERCRRKDGSDADYKNQTRGAGAQETRQKLLQGWLLDNKSTKGQHYRSVFKSLCVTKVEECDNTWMPQKWMEDKYGKTELVQRVEAGTLAVRKNPLDPRFYEFRDIKVSERVVKAERRAQGEQTGQTDAAGFLKFWNASSAVNDLQISNDPFASMLDNDSEEDRENH